MYCLIRVCHVCHTTITFFFFLNASQNTLGCCLLILFNSILLTHLSLETPKKVFGKQCRPDQMLQNGASDQGLHCLQIV